MSFMDSLAANPSGSSGIYGQGSRDNSGDQTSALWLVNSLKDREMNDFKDKANFMSDLSLKQDRLRRIYDQQDSQQQGPQNTVMAKDPNQMTGYEKGELGIRQQQLGLESAKLAQTGKMGEERIGIQRDQEKLNALKNQNIYDTKMADMERKANEATARMGQAHDALQANVNDHKAHLEFLKAKQEADDARHALERAQVDAKHAETKKKDDATIAALNKRVKDAEHTKVETNVNPDGTKKTVETTRGSAATRISVTHRNGSTGTIPGDLESIKDWNANHAAPGTEIDIPDEEK
jgi:hypothetical protein